MSVYTRLTKEELEQLLNDYNIGDPIDIQGINEGLSLIHISEPTRPY